MWPLEPCWLVTPQNVIRLIRSAKKRHNVEGVTFLGGEPMLQAKGLAKIARAAWHCGLSVMVFTGYTFSKLKRMRPPGAEKLLSYTDILVDGPYMLDFPETMRNWVGSSNQRFYFLTNRYSPDIVHDPAFGHGVEVRISANNCMTINGWPITKREDDVFKAASNAARSKQRIF
jgi:anaerobic ribonucleoside-triphosphate reductase activating protein